MENVINSVNDFPNRLRFLDQSAVNADRKKISSHAPFAFMSNGYDVIYGAEDNIVLTGVSVSGLKVAVILENTKNYIAVECPTDERRDHILCRLKLELEALKTKYVGHEYSYEYPFHGFHQKPVQYLRIYYNKIKAAKCILESLTRMSTEEGWNVSFASTETSKADIAKKICAIYPFRPAGWNLVKTYKPVKSDYSQCPNYDIVISANVCDVISSDDGMPERDKSIMCSFDIETRSYEAGGIIPKPGMKYDFISIACSFHWMYDKNAFARVVIVQTEIGELRDQSLRAGTWIVKCRSNGEMARAFADICIKLKPEMFISYNGSDFDWPLIVDWLKRENYVVKFYDGLAVRPSYGEDPLEGILKYNISNTSIKIEAGKMYEMKCNVKISGLIDVDVMPIMFKKFRDESPRAASLAYYLQRSGLPPKNDISLSELFGIYDDAKAARESGDPARIKAAGDAMVKLIEYNIIDTVRPVQLLLKHAILSDKREVANLSGVFIFDSYYRADSAKVINFLNKYCSIYGVAFDSRFKSKGGAYGERDDTKLKYEGAWVFPPVRKLGVKDPCAGLDFSSLYPSLIRTYGFSPDMVVSDSAEAERLIAEGYILRKVGPTNGYLCEKQKVLKTIQIDGWVVRDNGLSAKPQAGERIVTGYSKKVLDESTQNCDDPVEYLANCADKVDCKFANRKCVREVISGRPALPGERKSIFAVIMGELFDLRVPVKHLTVKYKEMLNEMKGGKCSEEEREDIQLKHDIVNAKQNAIKLLMNTFYGTSGMETSPVYNTVVAAGITEAGRMNIKAVSELVKSCGFRVCYGDTDSLYLRAPRELYKEVRERFASGAISKLEMWHDMVVICQNAMTAIRELVLDYLVNTTSTQYLSMAYEEVCFPYAFFGRKKYAAIEHLQSIDFNRKATIKGLDAIKRGQYKFTTDICTEFVNAILRHDLSTDRISVAKMLLDKFHKTEYDLDMFAKTAKWNKNKNNAQIGTFINTTLPVARRTYSRVPGAIDKFGNPIPGDSFRFVIVDIGDSYEINGNIHHPSVGEKMMYVDAFKYLQLQGVDVRINKRDYISKLVNQMARIIAGEQIFKVGLAAMDGAVDAKTAYENEDQHTLKAAIKYLNDYYNTISTSTVGCKVDGSAIRKTFAGAVEVVRSYLSDDMWHLTRRISPTRGFIKVTEIYKSLCDKLGKYKTTEDSVARMIVDCRKIMIALYGSVAEAHKALIRSGANYAKINKIGMELRDINGKIQMLINNYMPIHDKLVTLAGDVAKGIPLSDDDVIWLGSLDGSIYHVLLEYMRERRQLMLANTHYATIVRGAIG